ncbi:Uncharacterised protein [Slackia heliotrinireducens]|uniref:DUF4037 domain-containing protein n=1 Tax=Slackia heliotrinireducens (strain ATCC 29202 / DSM 20476 / NCTC 11029 / RHS 1) TaxID=471855 RepID=C7N7G0_SLAHD|nr:DUF4037 domain-containing protein [Slackia heliotrinireducens]ACV22845.1 hypothetical protein Shel_18270 [Slackia heliotrinireducens DSM 20476]VEH01591.1 Uncharacterised protein [Slackia heliotrinireducens]
MQGLEISKAYFDEYGMPMLREQFGDLMPHLAAGLFGSGSECFGFDDELSRDHDFDPGFMLLLPGEDVIDRKQEFALERAYAKLPKEFMGVKRPMLAPVGGARRGVLRAADVFREKTGSPDGILTVEQWLTTPSHALAEAVNGRVFFDGSGEVTRIRQRLSRYPEDIRRKKLAGHLLSAGQAGQYNYRRCLDHGESAAAQLTVFSFVQSAMETVFLLNNVYQPFYKWRFRAMRALPKLALDAELFEYLLTTHNDGDLAEEKLQVIEGIAADLIEELQAQGLTRATCGDLEKHAYSVNDGIVDGDIRNLHILAGV